MSKLYEKYPYFYGEMPLDMMLYADTMAGDDTGQIMADSRQ